LWVSQSEAEGAHCASKSEAKPSLALDEIMSKAPAVRWGFVFQSIQDIKY